MMRLGATQTGIPIGLLRAQRLVEKKGEADAGATKLQLHVLFDCADIAGIEMLNLSFR